MRNPAQGGASVSLAGDTESSTPKPNKSPPLKPSRQVRWQAANRKARWAHVCLQSALRRGLTHREPCVICGDEKVDGHHDDYDKPMAVVWLYRKHHLAAHRQASKAK
jgi:hypothetical protein